MGVGHLDDQGPLAQIEPGIDVERVIVGRDHPAAPGPEQFAGVHEDVAPAARVFRPLASAARMAAPGGRDGTHAGHLGQGKSVRDGLLGQSKATFAVQVGRRHGIGHSVLQGF